MRYERKDPCAIPILEGTYNVIYIDPPGGIALTMKWLFTIKLPISPKGVVFLRVRQSEMLDALRLKSVWGFDYKTNMAVLLPGGYEHDLLFVLCPHKQTFIPVMAGRPARDFSSVLDARLVSSPDDLIVAKIMNHYPGCKFLNLFQKGSNKGVPKVEANDTGTN